MFQSLPVRDSHWSRAEGGNGLYGPIQACIGRAFPSRASLSILIAPLFGASLPFPNSAATIPFRVPTMSTAAAQES